MPDKEKCAGCGTVLDSSAESQVRVPCPDCGSMARVIEVSFSLTLESSASTGFKHKRVGCKKPIAEGFSGKALFAKEQQLVDKERLIDREANRYREKVTDPATGAVIHECDEPLDDHTGHGSAKPKGSP
jgi:hypothetical protein